MGMEERLNEIINDLMRRANNSDKEEGKKCSCGNCDSNSTVESILNHPVISSTTKCLEVMEELIPTIDKEKIVDKEMSRMVLYVLYEMRKDLMSDLAVKEGLADVKNILDSIRKDLN